MTTHELETPRPVHLFTEIGRGSVQVTATGTTRTRIDITGRDADLVEVHQDGDHVSVKGPRQRGFFGDSRLDVLITLPTGSPTVIRTGSADITLTGTVGQSRLKSGSGEVEVETVDGALAVETGSGDIRVERVHAELKVKSGSGDVVVRDAGGAAMVSTGSGDVHLATAHGPAAVKTGSGDLKVGEASTDVTLTTGSGDMVVATARSGRVTAKGASGDVHVGVPAGIPVWTDISTVTGAIRSTLQGAGQPEDGAPYVEVRAKVVSGDIVLAES